MQNIRCFILEDVQREIEDLTKNLHLFPEIEIIGSGGEVQSAISEIFENEPDLLFWDYNLTGGTGFHVLEGLEKLGASMPFCVGTSAQLLRRLDYPALVKINNQNAVHLPFITWYDRGRLLLEGKKDILAVTDAFKPGFEAHLRTLNW